MSADKRSTHTDALATLGTIIDNTAGRDAIHLAVEPVIAGQELFAGDHIGLVGGKAYALTEYDGTQPAKALGIVDPFITGPVGEGQMFWLIVYPRTITSLRHVWSHPDFAEANESSEVAQEVTSKLLYGDSIEYIHGLADQAGVSYERIMEVAKGCAEGDWDYINTGDNEISVPDEFWDHFERITGKKVARRGGFFSCSC